MSTEQAPEVAARLAVGDALVQASAVEDFDHRGEWAAFFIETLKDAGWQLTRVGDEERLRAAAKAVERLFSPMYTGGSWVARPDRIAALNALEAALAPQPPSPASQGEER